MKSWRLLVRAKGQRLCRAGVGVAGNVELKSQPHRNLSYGAVDACSSGAEGEQSRQPRGSWTPHVFGLFSVGLLLCGGRKGTLKFVTTVSDVT